MTYPVRILTEAFIGTGSLRAILTEKKFFKKRAAGFSPVVDKVL
jgi:hypothetical protein